MPSSRTRARDADRDALCRALDRSFDEGQLDGEEHRERTATALKARTLGELRALVDDLQLTDAPDLRERTPPPTAPRRSQARWVGLGVSLVLLAVGFTVGRVSAPSGPEVAAAADGPVQEVSPQVVRLEGLHTAAGFARFVEDVRARTGSTLVVDATLYPEYASVETAVADNPRRTETWSYRGGMDGPNSTGTRDADEGLVDLSVFSTEILMPLVAGAPETLNVTDANQRYLILRTDEGGPYASIYASNEYRESGYLKVRPDGSVAAVHAHEPG